LSNSSRVAVWLSLGCELKLGCLGEPCFLGPVKYYPVSIHVTFIWPHPMIPLLPKVQDHVSHPTPSSPNKDNQLASTELPSFKLIHLDRTLGTYFSTMSDQIQEFMDIPRDFIKDGTQFINRCTKRTYNSPRPLARSDFTALL